jgi:hypothetical protein
MFCGIGDLAGFDGRLTPLLRATGLLTVIEEPLSRVCVVEEIKTFAKFPLTMPPPPCLSGTGACACANKEWRIARRETVSESFVDIPFTVQTNIRHGSKTVV